MALTTSIAELTAAVLAGGKGTRLAPVVGDRPKVLALVRGRPFLAYILDQLAHAGIRKTILLTGYMAQQVEETFGTVHGPMQLLYSREETPLGTAGALRQALPLQSGPTILMMNGDSYCQADLHAFYSWHRARRAKASILLATVPSTARYGRVITDDQGMVLKFVEKGGSPAPGDINAGAYLLDRELVAEIPAGREVSIEREVFPAWVGQGLMAYRGGERFIDIGTPESFAKAEAFFDPSQRGSPPVINPLTLPDAPPPPDSSSKSGGRR
jgi:NDP-sugar pyrophosphorylase family protein